MKRSPTFSIIICLYVITPKFYEDFKKYKNLTYRNFEIILAVEKDAQIEELPFPVRIVKAKKKPISLGEKRDLGFKAARGKYCAYIDDDAYPTKDWLTKALKIFSESDEIGAVGGPNLTPQEDSFWGRIGGYIYESYFTSGEAQYRFLPKKRRLVSELQGVNLIIRRDILKKVGGFNSRLNSGDDTKVCNAIVKLGYQVVYDPRVQVYHHRKPFPKGHLRQIRNMGTHRGFFIKGYPDSFAYIYFLPVLLTSALAGGLILSILFPWVRFIYLVFVLFVFLIMYVSTIKRAGFKDAFVVVIGILVTHIVYSIFFLKGLTLQKIEK